MKLLVFEGSTWTVYQELREKDNKRLSQFQRQSLNALYSNKEPCIKSSWDFYGIKDSDPFDHDKSWQKMVPDVEKEFFVK